MDRRPARGLRGAVVALATWLIASLWDWLFETARVDRLPNVTGSGARQQNNPERPASPQPEPFFSMRTRLGDANQNSGNIRGSYNTAYNMDAVAGGERARRDNFGRPASSPPTISTSMGNYNSGCGNVEGSGNTAISYRMGTTAASNGHVGDERRMPAFN